jgi:peptidoglycan hydrolase-like protein with peptidoglycan-binding domain/DNA invertase Pin-like site-specific DNA recombinase
MKIRHRVDVREVSVASVVGCLALLCIPAASVAAEASTSSVAAADRGSALLARGSGFGQRQGGPRVRALQRRLRALGHRPGPVDGLYGPVTEAAVEQLQHDSGVSVDGIVGPQTRRVLSAEAPPLAPSAGYGQPGGSPQVRGVQRSLRALGHRPGPVDGLYGPRTQASVERFQRSAGQPPSGVVSFATATALERAGNDRPARASDASEARADGRARPAPGGAGIERPDGAESVSPVLLAALALGLAALAGLLVAWLRGRQRPERPGAADRGLTSSGRTPRRWRKRVVALGYVSVPEPGSAHELQDQLAAIDTACRQRGLELKEVIREVEQADDRGPVRPGMRNAFRRLAAGEATCLVVGELGRLSRSAPEVGHIVGSLRRRGIRLVAVGDGLDTGLKGGAEAADMLVSLSRFDARRPRPAQTGRPRSLPDAAWNGKENGGRPSRDDAPALKKRIAAMRASGMTLQAIADRLNAENVPTLRGGTKWRPSGVQAAAGYRRPDRAASGAANGGETAANGSSEARRARRAPTRRAS